jgi:hypothetical protein
MKLAPYKVRLTLSLFVLITASSCDHGSPSALALRRIPSAQSFPAPAPELGESWDAKNEDEAAQILGIIEESLAKTYANDAYVRRDAHPKHHGCVKAFFNVDASRLPADLRVGIFAAPAGTSYPAWIRFSNGSPSGATAPDLKKDVRGMAVKLMGIEGSESGSQDFLMCSAHEFFSKDSADYLEFHHGAFGSKFDLVKFGITHPLDVKRLFAAEIQESSPLSTEYFSSVPYLLGSKHTMKFQVRPCPTEPSPDALPGNDASPNYLREKLVGTLAKRAACFDFFVQPNESPDTQLVEDPRIVWDETSSPLIQVARITIPVQSEIDSTEHLNFCENISFDPWHSLPATRPMGQINRARALIYRSISEYRHQENHVPIIEPKSHEICTGPTAALCQTPAK